MAGNWFTDAFANPGFRTALSEMGQDLGYGLANSTNIGNAFGEATRRSAQMQPYRDLAQQQKAEEEKRAAQINATAAFLRSKGAEDLATAVEGGMTTGADAFNQWYQQANAPAEKPIEVNGQLVNPMTGQVLGDYRDAPPTGPDPEKLFGMEKDLAAQYSGQDPVKTYQAVRNGYERVRASATQNTGAGDISMIFAYMKMLDPTSVVREGEFATAETAGGAGEQIANLYNRVLSGERLTPELRKEFMAAADKLYQESSANLSSLNEQYTTRAGAWGVDPGRFVISPEAYDAVPGIVTMPNGNTVRPL